MPPACYDELTLCLRQAMYQDTGLACVRYPRGADNTIFDKSALNTAYTHTAGCRTDTLLIGYGRTYDLLYRAKQAAEKEGFSCDLLKLTQIFPLPELVPSICRSYQRILFFEEAYYYGGFRSCWEICCWRWDIRAVTADCSKTVLHRHPLPHSWMKSACQKLLC